MEYPGKEKKNYFLGNQCSTRLKKNNELIKKLKNNSSYVPFDF
jgi:hypothetical protein